jgi:signal transduction histidine kinase
MFRVPGVLSRHGKVPAADVLDAPSEWVIAQGRLFLCAISVVALSLDPPPPAHFAVATQTILLGYFVYAFGLVIATNWRLPDAASQFGIHAADVVVTSLLLLLTQGPTSPFFSFFAFVLLAATLRWNWSGVLITLGILLIVLLAANIQDALAAPADKGNELNRIIIRGAHLAVVGSMLAYVGAYRERSRRRLAYLATWPAYAAGEHHLPAFASTLAHAAEVMSAPRVLTMWQETDESRIKFAAWDRRSYREWSEPSDSIGDLIAPSLTDLVFATASVSNGLVLLHTGHQQIPDNFVDMDFAKRCEITSLASAPFSGSVCRGRVFILDRGLWNEEHLLLTSIIASRIGVELDRQVFQGQAQQAAAIHERARLAGDLHDGVLQSLTAARLQLIMLEKEADAKSASRFEVVKQLLSTEQRRLRRFVDSTRTPEPVGFNSLESTSDKGLQELIADAAKYWNCEVTISVDPKGTVLPKELDAQLTLLMSESISNATRHGGATRVDIAIVSKDSELIATISDNGRGFEKTTVERSEAVKLDEPVMLPASIERRVEQLHGSLEVRSTPKGVRLRIRVPLE